MKICSLDSSTKKTGIAFFEDCLYKEHILIDHSKEKDVEKRINLMGKDILSYLKNKKPDIIICEHPQGRGSNVSMVGKLCEVIGIARAYSISKGLFFYEYMPSSWRKLLGWNQGKKKREELKKMSIDYIKNKYGIDATDDEADCICIGLAYIENFDKKEVN